MKQQRILHVSEEPVFNLGGVGKIVQWLISGSYQKYSVSLAAPDALNQDVPPEFISQLEYRFTVPEKKWNPELVQQFVGRIQEDDYDLIHFHGGTFSFDAHLPWRSPLHRLCRLSIPWILSNHCAPSLTEGLFSPGYPAPARFIKSVLAWASKCFLLHYCRQEVFDSDENRGQINRWFPWARSKMRTIYHSSLDGAPPEPLPAPKVTTIGNLGHFGWRKGQQDLLIAFAQVHEKFPGLKLILAGPHNDNNDCARWIRKEIDRLNLAAAVDLPGGLTDKTAFWNRVDIYVQPSHYEGAPMALMEALWMGKPAIGTRVSGIPEMIQNDVNGILVTPAQPTELAAAIGRLIADNASRERYSQNAANWIVNRGMTRPQMLQGYFDLYQRLRLGTRNSE